MFYAWVVIADQFVAFGITQLGKVNSGIEAGKPGISGFSWPPWKPLPPWNPDLNIPEYPSLIYIFPLWL